MCVLNMCRPVIWSLFSDFLFSDLYECERGVVGCEKLLRYLYYMYLFINIGKHDYMIHYTFYTDV